MLYYVLLVAEAGMFFGSLYFMYESIREKERRAPKVGAGGAAIALLLAAATLFFPVIRIPIAILFGVLSIFGLACFIPAKRDDRALAGAKGHAVSKVERFDERDTTFSRFRSLPEGTEIYKEYYSKHPEKEEPDKKRREKGFLGVPGRIDNGYRPNVARVFSAFELPHFLGNHTIAEPEPEVEPYEMTPEKATEYVKNYTLHMGADLVGICKVDQNYVYSHRGDIHFED